MTKNFSTEILTRGFAMDGVHLIAASAGTGKTYSLQNVYARLVFERGLKPSEILVVTFTVAATAELRDRLRRILSDLVYVAARKGVLVDAADRQRHAQALGLYENLFPTGDEGALALCRARLESAVAEFDTARILTIHGFCQRLLRCHAFESGFSFATEVCGESSEELTRRTEDYWRVHGAELEEDPVASSHEELDMFVQAVSKNVGATVLPHQKNKESCPTVGSLFEAAESIVHDYERARTDRLELTYDDLLGGVHDALGGPLKQALVEAVRAEYKAALIDEFQDTDSVQYQVFKTLFAESASHPVFFVGDAKQSIYAFRGGDVYTYCAAAAAVPEDGRYSLSVNYRSARPLVDAVNRLFGDKENPGDTFGHPEAAYEPVSAQGKPLLQIDGHDDPHPFRIVRLLGGTGKQKNCSVVSADFPTTVLMRIRTLLGSANIRPRDITVLCRTKDLCHAVASLLISKGIRAVCPDDEKVTKAKEAELLLMVLRAMSDSSNVRNLRALLLSDFCGLGLGDIQDTNLLGRYAEKFRDAGEIWRRTGLVAALTHLRQEMGFDERIASQGFGERRLTDFVHLTELVNTAIANGALGIVEATSWLEGVLRGRISLGEAAELRLDSDEDAVCVQTIHKSKGLEYPVVILPFPYGKKPSPHEFEKIHKNGDTLLFVPEIAGEETIEDWERESAEENVRLYYVAMTRASRHCEVLVNSNEKKIEPSLLSRLAQARERNDDGLIWEETIAKVPPAEEVPFWTDPKPRPSADALAVAEVPVFAAPWTHGSYSSLCPSVSATPKDIDADPQGEPEVPSEHPLFRLFRGGARTGTAWHELFEKISFQASRREREERAEVILRGNGVLKAGNDEESVRLRREAVAASVEMMEAVLALPLSVRVGDPSVGTFCLSEIPDVDRQEEWEFEYHPREGAVDTTAIRSVLERHWPDRREFLDQLDGWERQLPTGWMTGFVDLLFRRDGRYYVVDWKSNSLGGIEDAFTADGIRSEMAVHGYFLQYLLYATVLHAYLKEAMEDYDYDRHFGGIAYVFLRGAVVAREKPAGAVFEDRPSLALLEDLAEALGLERKGA